MCIRDRYMGILQILYTQHTEQQKMFSLIKGYYQYLFAKPTYKILLLGVDGAGKTTLLNQIKAMHGQKSLALDKITQTVGLNIARIENEGRFPSLFWDLGGQAILRPIWKKYYNECHAIIYVIDGSDPAKEEEALKALDDLLANRELEGVPFLVLINKSDQENSKTTEYFSEKIRIEKYSEREILVISASALKQQNIMDSLKWVYRAIINFYRSATSGKK
eukprot:TRINITY_DN2384_c0_g1_i5.p1 TRINITY_DN2384_c0_g1~~TRINITY_DN2384_c0_g1_i5.p1  ORF type:complete len:240 (-),score=57.83 TRINITY_DN2384_c0_g1_i5:209-868(-)